MRRKKLDKYLQKYPFDIKDVLSKKKRIRKKLLSDLKNPKSVKIAILSGSTTSEIRDILELFLLSKNITPTFYESDYNRYYEEAVFENTKLKEFLPDIVYIHTTNRNISLYPELTDSKDDIGSKLREEVDRYKTIWLYLKKTFNCIIIQNNFELPRNRDLGNLEFSNPAGKINFIMRLNLEFALLCEEIKGVYINDINYLSSWFGLEKWHDNRFWYSYKYALSYEAIPILAHNIAKIVCAVYGKTKKCLVLDLDNTLWGGIIGDDDLSEIEIGPDTPTGEAFHSFQKYIRRLKDRGVILSVCSKNELSIAKTGFSHPNTVLKLEDFHSFKANWDLKTTNIVEIADEVNIGLESIVFVDDNPTEREVKDEYLKILGRNSEIINVGGEKVYPSEIENLIQEIDNVREVTVIGKKHPVTGNIVCAKIRTFHDESRTELSRRVKRYCKERLPAYKVPVRVVISETSQSSERLKKVRQIP
jgi:HAD superfamily phosphatase (TIGR01681 family)